MASDIPPWEEIISEIVRSVIAELHTATPATVLVYDPVRQAATVQLAIAGRVDDTLLDIERPDLPPAPIPNAPVCHASGATWSIVGPLLPGDPVTVVFAERSTDEWRTAGAPVNVPLDARRHDYTDAIVFPGGRSLVPGGATPTAALPPTAFDPLMLVIRSDVGLKLGSSLAVEPLVKGVTFTAGLTTFLTALAADATNPAIAAAASAYLAVLGVPAHLSVKVFTE